jgi:hypothetical protein
MKGSMILSLVGVAVIMLVIGTALGSLVFPISKTQTTTIFTSSNSLVPYSGTIPFLFQVSVIIRAIGRAG